jgi:hypothetical protein
VVDAKTLQRDPGSLNGCQRLTPGSPCQRMFLEVESTGSPAPGLSGSVGSEAAKGRIRGACLRSRASGRMIRREVGRVDILFATRSEV